MLPNIPKTKREIGRLLSHRVRKATMAQAVVASLAQPFIQHEGRKHTYYQEGTGTVTDEYEKFEVPLMLTVDEIRKPSAEVYSEKFEKLAEAMAEKISKYGFQVLDEVTRKAGNALDAHGEPFSKKHVLQLLEGVDMTFDSDGKPEFVWIAHPEMAKAMAEVWPSWAQDAEFMANYNSILQKKKEAWLDRQSNRKLVE